MTEKIFTEDIVCLKEDPSFLAVVEHTWRDPDFSPISQTSGDWIHHSGVSQSHVRHLFQEGLAPEGYVVVRFAPPDAGVAMVKEGDLALRDRGLLVGDVVKKHPSDTQSGYVVGIEMLCTLEPIYTDLPYFGNQPWSYLPEENRLKVPMQELEFWDYMVGDNVMYQGWVGELTDMYQEVTIRLENGGVVRVKDSFKLEAYDPFEGSHPHSLHGQTLTNILRAIREQKKAFRRGNKLSPVDLFYPGQVIFTEKSNLRLGSWVIGSYDPSVPPRGVVVEVRAIEMTVHWLMCNLFNKDKMTPRPPTTLGTDELDQVRLYNRNTNPASSPNITPGIGSRGSEDRIGCGDYVKFKDNRAAEAKYSASNPHSFETGIYRRIPREMTQGFDMNTFCLRETELQVRVQWQDGSYSEEPSTALMPYVNVDEHDVWVGEICSLVSSETRTGNKLVVLGKLGVVQTVNSRERTAVVRWFRHNEILMTEDGVVVWGDGLGPLEEGSETVSLYEIVMYPSLTNRRGDLVSIQPDYAVDHEYGWFGEIVDLGIDGQLTIRLGGLEEVRDVRVPVDKVLLMFSGDNTDYGDDSIDEAAEGSSMSEDYEEGATEEVFYEGGQRMDDGGEDEWLTDEDEDEDTDMDDLQFADAIENLPGAFPNDRDQSPQPEQEKPPPPPSLPQPTSDPLDPTTHRVYRFSALDSMPAQFEILSSPPPDDNPFASKPPALSASLMRRIRKEHSVLASSLPEGIWVRAWDERLDLLRILMVGPRNTPYELAPFVFDVSFGKSYPDVPPAVHFHSWTGGIGRINPNLYEDGKVCLSVLGTWPERESTEGWNRNKSSVLQVLVSVLGLVLVEQPYYNEAGFENMVGSEDTIVPSKLYSEKAYCMAKGFVKHALKNGVPGMEQVVNWLYLDPSGPRLLRQVVQESRASMECLPPEDGNANVAREREDEAKRGAIAKMSEGAKALMRMHLGYLEEKLGEMDGLA